MKNKKFYISLIACLIPLIIGLIYFESLPEELPTHWNAAGEIDGFMSKPMVLFGLPLFMLGLHVFVIWMMHKDPKYQNIPKVMLNLMYLFMPFLSIIIMFITINASIENGLDFNAASLVTIFISVIFIVIGNYLPKCKQSYTVGIKTPWALNDEENWNKTHRLAGFLWLAGGIVILLSSIFIGSTTLTIIFLSVVVSMTFIPFAYSYMLYAKKIKQNNKL